MSEIKFDKPRLLEMERFLTRLYQIGIENPDVKIDVSLVYRELCRYELPAGDIKSDGNYVNCDELFKKWIDRKRDGENPRNKLFLDPSDPQKYIIAKRYFDKLIENYLLNNK